MENLYNRNGLIFWNQKELRLRRMFVEHFVCGMGTVLASQNKAFQMMEVEAPLLTPSDFINKNYTKDDYYEVASEPVGLVLRPETTMGSYQYAKWLMEHTETKTKLPLCIWQHGKSFRKEQDQVTKNMRLKEFYQLEFQCIYGLTTANDYSLAVYPAVKQMISEMIGPCHLEPSDRLPDYSEETVDIICDKTGMEVCSMSKRKDFPNAKVLEVAIGTDRCVFNFMEK